MPNIASVLKAEVARVARKQARAETAALKKAITKHRSDIAELKRLVGELTRELRSSRRQSQAAARAAPASAAQGEGKALRFNAKGFVTHRHRLGLSAAECGRLLGVTGQSIYLWESGRARPRSSLLPAIAALRGMGKRQVAERLAALG